MDEQGAPAPSVDKAPSVVNREEIVAVGIRGGVGVGLPHQVSELYAGELICSGAPLLNYAQLGGIAGCCRSKTSVLFVDRLTWALISAVIYSVFPNSLLSVLDAY